MQVSWADEESRERTTDRPFLPGRTKIAQERDRLSLRSLSSSTAVPVLFFSRASFFLCRSSFETAWLLVRNQKLEPKTEILPPIRFMQSGSPKAPPFFASFKEVVSRKKGTKLAKTTQREEALMHVINLANMQTFTRYTFSLPRSRYLYCLLCLSRWQPASQWCICKNIFSIRKVCEVVSEWVGGTYCPELLEATVGF